MTSPSIWQLVQRYISGQCSQQEREKIEQWMRKDPANEELIRDLKQIWEFTPEEEFDIDVQEAWNKFRQREIDSKQRIDYTADRRNHSRLLLNLYRTAAVVLIAVLSGFFVWHFKEQPRQNTVQHGDFYVMQDLITEQGEKARVKFSDGTAVILNASSALRFPKKFSGPTREVYLEGEAFFKVTHNSERPFIVRAQGATVEVMGTEFNVRAWNDDPDMGVTVKQGKVTVAATSNDSEKPEEVVLTRGQYSRVIKGKEPSPAKSVDVNNYLLWLNGGMHFDDTPFSQVIRQLERRFDIQVSVHDQELLDVPFTAVLKDADLDDVLKIISASMETEYRKEGVKVEFRPFLNENTNPKKETVEIEQE